MLINNVTQNIESLEDYEVEELNKNIVVKESDNNESEAKILSCSLQVLLLLSSFHIVENLYQ